MTDRAASSPESTRHVQSGSADADSAGTSGLPSAQLADLGWALGLAPITVRAASQGLFFRALVVAAVAFIVSWVAPRRWIPLGTVAAVTIVGIGLLPVMLGVAAGAFAAAGLVVAGRLDDEPLALDARTCGFAGWLVGSLILLFSPLVSVPTAIVVLFLGAALVLHRMQPAWSRNLSDHWSAAAARWAGPPSAALRQRSTELHQRWQERSKPPVRWLIVTCGVVAAVGIVLAIRDQRFVLFDDAAITFRYAVRIASGDGFTYNDGDRTNGASAPLYTLVISLGHLFFRDAEATARTIGVVCYGMTAGLVAAILGRARGLAAALLGAVVLLSSLAYRTEALSGMESGFAAMLGMLVIFLVMEGHITWAGVVLGLAIANKVDAGFLAVAVGAASWLVLRKPPWRLAWIAAVTAAPWFLFSLLYFGSLLPFSATQKVGGEVADPSSAHDPLWIYRRLESDGLELLLIAGLLLTVLVAVRLVRLEQRAALATLCCGFWVVLHGGAFSMIDLGDAYPWYTTVLFPPLVVAGIMALFGVAGFVGELLSAAIDRRGATPMRAVLTGATTLLLALVLLSSLRPGIESSARVVRDGRDVSDYERFEETRRAAGRYVGDRARPGEVVQSCFGWIAYGALDNPFRETCPLSTQVDPGRATWIVETFLDGSERGRPSMEYDLVRTFDSSLGVTFVYRDRG